MLLLLLSVCDSLLVILIYESHQCLSILVSHLVSPFVWCFVTPSSTHTPHPAQGLLGPLAHALYVYTPSGGAQPFIYVIMLVLLVLRFCATFLSISFYLRYLRPIYLPRVLRCAVLLVKATCNSVYAV